MAARLNAIFFDWNGTLLADTLCCWRASNIVLEHLGKAPVSMQKYRAHFNVPLDQMYRAFGCSAQELIDRFDVIHDVWNSAYDNQVKKARLRRGARALLHALNKKPEHSVILSNQTIANIASHIQRLDVHDCFTALLANDAPGPAFVKRNKGERLNRYLNERRISRAIIVGDTEEEIDIAKEHGLVSIAITDGVCSTRRLKAAKPDFLIDSLTEIPAIADRVFGLQKEAA